VIKIAWGATRFVVLTPRYAFKFARPPQLLWALKRLFDHSRTGEVGVKLKRYHSSPLLGGLKYIFAGVVTNMREDELWQRHRPSGFVPTSISLFGLLNIQRCGEAVTQDELECEYPFAHLNMIDRILFDVDVAKNFVRLDGTILLADYGCVELWEQFTFCHTLA
jgi:hypothetical protein